MTGMRDSATAKEFLQMADMLCEKGYRLGPKVGEGSYAKVRVAERQKDGKIMAVKIVNKKKAAKDYVTKFLPREMTIVMRMDHKNIITTYEIFQVNDMVYMIMDYAERGDLLDYIRKNGAVSDKEARNMFYQFADAIKYLHDMDISHRDLKCENVLLLRDRSLAVADFGFAKDSDKDEATGKRLLSKTFCGSAAYASPELLRGIPYEPKLNDVWSMGCILYIMVSGSMPFDDHNVKKMVTKQLSEKVTFPTRVQDKIHTDCKHLVRQMLEPDVTKRISVDQIMSSLWLKERTETG